MIKLLMTDPLYNQQIGVSAGCSLSSCLHNSSQLCQTLAIHLVNGQSKHLDCYQLCCIVLITNCSCCISLQKYLLFSTGRMILQAQVSMQVPCASLVSCFLRVKNLSSSREWAGSVALYKNFHCV